MSEDIPFNRTLALAPGQIEEVAPGVRRLLCDNPSPFTFKGTMSYIVGRGHVAIIDPGPDDARHIDALLGAVRNETVTHIVVTHTHRDHSPGAARVQAATGAATFGEGPHRAAGQQEIEIAAFVGLPDVRRVHCAVAARIVRRRRPTRRTCRAPA